MSRRIPPTESTESPYWMIINPDVLSRERLRDTNAAVYRVASMITGPFLSRAAAQAELDCRPHAYRKGARVFCLSGHQSPDWVKLCREEVSE